MSRKRKIKECTVCYDCKWVYNDSDKSPFYDLNFSNLKTGDEIIRCWKCNSIPGVTYLPKSNTASKQR